MAAFPYLLQGGFETGAVDSGMALTDTDSKGAYPHYTTSITKYGIAPWRGAYCFLIDNSIGTATTDVIQTVAGMNVSANVAWAVGFALYLKDNVMTAGDRTTIFELDSGTNTNEVTLQLYYTAAAGIQLLLTETAGTAVGSNPAVPIEEDQWHWVELYGINDPGSNDGTAYLVLDGRAIGSISSLDQGAFTDSYMGKIDSDAGHTAGIIAFDDVIQIISADNTAVRVGYRNRYPMNIHVSAITTASCGEHLFIGPGTISEVSLLTANAGDMIRLYDTDRAYTTGTYNLVAECNYSSGYPVIAGPLEFNRGCYCVTTAAGAGGARGVVKIDPAPADGYAKAIYYGFPENLRRYALTTRKELNGNM